MASANSNSASWNVGTANPLKIAQKQPKKHLIMFSFVTTGEWRHDGRVNRRRSGRFQKNVRYSLDQNTTLGLNTLPSHDC